MKIGLLGFFLIATGGIIKAQNIYTSNNAVLSLFSSAPIEDIKAESRVAVTALDIASRTIYFKVQIRSFEFEKRLMQEHFNENYMESDKYPYAEFKGSIKEPIDFSKDGSYVVTIQGNLNMHHVIKNYTVKAEFTVQGTQITAHATFPVKLIDHRIKIPRLVIKNIAEIVQITVSAKYKPVAK